MSRHQRHRTQLSFARQIVKSETLSELNLIRQLYRAELGRQSPEREVLDLLSKATEGHLHVRELATAGDSAPPAPPKLAPSLTQPVRTRIERSPDCCGCASFPNVLCPPCMRFNFPGSA
jgi:hypothetical protein